MKKKVFGRKLSRSRPAREALFASLAKSLILNGKIETTRAKAKAVIPDVEKMVTLAKKGEIAGRRKVLTMLDNAKEPTKILFKDIAKAFMSKNSGFTRITSLPRRVGDNAEMARLEWTEKIAASGQELVVSKKANKKEESKPVKKTEKRKKNK